MTSISEKIYFEEFYTGNNMSKPRFEPAFYLAWESLPVPLAISNYLGETFYFNRLARKLLELGENELPDMYAFYGNPGSVKKLYAQLEEKEFGLLEAVLQTKNNKEISTFIIARLIYDDNKTCFILSVFTDISLLTDVSSQTVFARSNYSTQLDLHKNLLFDITAEWKDAVILINREKIITFVNDAFTKLFGLAKEQVFGKTLATLPIFDRDSKAVRLMPDEFLTAEFFLENSDKKTPVSVSINPSIIDNVYGGAVVYVRDISFEKQLEEYRRQTAQFEYFGKLVGTFSGEINNALSLMLGYADLLKSAKSEEKAEECYAALRSTALRTKQIFASLFLTQNGQMPDLKQAVDNAAASILLEYPEEEIFEVKFFEPHLSVNINNEILTGILWALLKETAKASVGTIELSAKSDNNYAKLGIVFEPDQAVIDKTDSFFKPDNFDERIITPLRKKPFELDFTFLSAFVRTFAGELFMRTHKDKPEYKEIILSLPLAFGTTRIMPPVDRREQTPLAEPIAPPCEKTATRAKSILVVDDNEALAMLIREFLEEAGFDVEIANEPLKALEINRVFDLTIIDLIMAPISGLELYQKLLRKNEQAKPKALFITGDIIDDNLKEQIEAEGCQILLKPFEVEELRAAVKHLIG